MGLPGIRQIELAGLKAWPGIEREHDRQWVRRAAGGYTKRANSSGLAWAALGVLADNQPALALSGSVGCVHVYDDNYRKPAR